MHITANRPKKDAYKHMATHDHECAAPANAVNQNFFIGPRKVILTDITYFYYGIARTPIYLCVFRDAYTKQILGSCVDSRMTVGLVKSAYEDMMTHHSAQLKRNSEVFIHSDQGSQYLSTTFTRLLEDDGFIQSVSGRGNSQDNAPMESFFGKMKTQILDLVALCTDMETVRTMITGYLRRYNSEFYQYNLAGLTPDEFYTYVTTGIYPLDEYYGIKSTELMSVSELVAERRRIADEKNRKSREAYARKNEERNKLHKTPLQIIARDQRILRRQIWDWKQTEETAHKQIDHLNSILEKTKTAGEFISSLPQDKLDELMIPQNWQKYPQLNYIFEMKELF
jgi:transposase InsO family protein